MNAEGHYLYGFFRGDAPRSLGPVGIGGRQVYLYQGGGLSVAVSDGGAMDFSRLPREALLTCVSEHQRALEHLMPWGDVVPLKFGTWVRHPGEMDFLLARGQAQVDQAFASVLNRTEIDVVAGFQDLDGALKEVSLDREIVAFQRQTPVATKAAHHQARVTLGKMVKAALDKKRQGYAREITPCLERHAVACKHLDLRDDAMIVNVAVLMDKGEQQPLESAIEALDRRFEDRVNFRLIGPMPCNSFYTLMVHQVDFKAIDCARKCLELPVSVSSSDIRDAYMLMTREYHPDNAPSGTADPIRFESIHKSYRLLMGACPSGSFSFQEAEVNGWMDIRPVEGPLGGCP